MGHRFWVPLHYEGVERVIVSRLSARRRPPVGCALGRVGGCCPGVGLRVGLRWALGRCLPDVPSPGVPALLRCAGAVDGAVPA